MLPEERRRRMDMTEIFFIRAVAGYKMADSKHNENVRRYVEITG
jgi:hypothetical protein